MAIRRFDAPIGDVQKSVQTVFPSHRLTMIGIDGDPLDGGTQTYGFRDTATLLTDRLASDLMTRAHVEELHLSLLPIHGGGCVAALSAPLTAARRAQLGSGVALAAGGGLFGGWAISGIAAAIVLPLGLGTGGLLWIAGAAALGAGGGGGLGVAGSRARHLARQRRGRSALERLLQEVDLAVRTGRGPTEVPD